MGISQLAAQLERAVARCRPGAGSATLLFSGGLDSSLVAYLAARQGTPLNLVTIGVPPSGDLERAASAAEILGQKVRQYEVGKTEVRESYDRGTRRQPTLGRTDRSVQVAMDLALSRVEDSWVICGQGADELFLGYLHTYQLSGDPMVERAEADLRKLTERDWPLTLELAKSYGKTLVSPYLDPGFLAEVATVPWSDRKGAERKSMLRAVATEVGLPPSLVGRPKKAFQYGSGIDRILRSFADR